MKRSEQREHIFKLVFRAEFYEADEFAEQKELYMDALTEIKEEDKAYILDKTDQVIGNKEEIDESIKAISEGWKIGRIGKVELALIRLAVYEIQYDDDIPTSVAINEAVELAKIYSGEQSARFVNGILAKLV